MQSKICNLCGIEKPLSEFRVRKSSSTGKEYHINQCNYCENNRYSHTCVMCGCEYTSKHTKSKYCSKECTKKARSKKIIFKCDNCGKESSVKPSIYNRAEHHYCSDKCHREHKPTWYKGDLIYNFNPNRTNVQRKKERKSNEDLNFINGVKKRDNYTCACCGKRGGVLVSHHIYSYNYYEKGRYDINNGITLCDECHLNFHKEYGFGNNDKKQLENFITNYYMVIPSRAY